MFILVFCIFSNCILEMNFQLRKQEKQGARSAELGGRLHLHNPVSHEKTAIQKVSKIGSDIITL